MKNYAIIVLMTGLCICVVIQNSLAQEPQSTWRLSLDEALELALKQNPEVAEAQSRLSEAEALLRSARAGKLPTLRIRGAYDYWTEEQRLYPATRNGEPGCFGPQILSAELILSLPIYTGGRISANIESAEWNRHGIVAHVNRTREILAYQVTALFYRLLAQDEILRSLEISVRAITEQQRTIQSLIDAGKAARVDLLRVNVRLAELNERLVYERNVRRVQQFAWGVLLGLDDASALEAKGVLEFHEHHDYPSARECVKKAQEMREDYRAASAMVSAADADVRAARAGYLPMVSIQAVYSERWIPDTTDRPDDIDNRIGFGRVGIVLEHPLFDGHLTRAKVEKEMARLRAAQERLRKLELQMKYEIETALSEIASARERVKTFVQAMNQADESFRIIKEKYALGKATVTDVLDAQTAFVTAQTSRSRALVELAVAEKRLKLSTGEILRHE